MIIKNMGVEDFYGKWINGIKQKYPLVKPTSMNNAFSLSIDMNGLIHMVAANEKAYAYGDRLNEAKKRQRLEEIKVKIHQIRKKVHHQIISEEVKKKEYSELSEEERETKYKTLITGKLAKLTPEWIVKHESLVEEEVSDALFNDFFNELTNTIDKNCGRFKVSNILNLAVDGPAPWAKNNQQRARRFRANLERQARATLTQDAFSFNASSNITPGTKWMQKLDDRLKVWIKERSGSQPRPSAITYSSFMVPGEGEHKIISDMRDLVIDSRGSDGINVIMGKDADLVILSVLSPLDHIVVNREKYDDNVDIDQLKIAILKEMNFIQKSDKRTEAEIQKICFQDFVLITFFVGNDFLPRIYHFKDVQASLDMFLNIYKTAKVRLTNLEGDILWENFYTYLSLVKEQQAVFLFGILDAEWTHPPLVLQACLDESDELDLEKFEILWYSNALMPRNDKGVDMMKKMFDVENPDISDIMEMTRQYLYGLQWVFTYYTTNNARKDFIYPYYYAPLLDEILNCIAAVVNEEIPMINHQSVSYRVSRRNNMKRLDKVSQIPHQLAMVTPPPVNEILLEPKLYKYVSYTYPLGPLSDLVPVTFEQELDTISGDKTHQSLVFLPNIDIPRVMNKIRISTLSAEMKAMIKNQKVIKELNRFSAVANRGGRGGSFSRGGRGGKRGISA